MFQESQSEPQHGLSLATFFGYDARLDLAEIFPCLTTDRGTNNHKKETESRSNNAGVTNTKHLVTRTFEPCSAFQDVDDDSELTSAIPRKSRLRAPQLQAQLSWLSDRTRLRRLMHTLCSGAAWQQVTRIEDLCHTHVSHKWLYHLDPWAGSVLTPHDYVTNVQKRLGNRTWTGFGQCRLCGSFLDHGELCSTAEATQGHYACVHAVSGGLKLADPGVTTEPRRLTESKSRQLKLADLGTTTETRGLTETQCKLADLFTAAVPGLSAALGVCAWPRSNAAAARGDAAQAALIAKFHIKDTKFLTCGIKVSSARLSGQQGDRTLPSPEPCSMHTSHPAATDDRCWRNPNSPPHTGSHDTDSPPQPISASRLASLRSTTGPGLTRSMEETMTMTQTQGQRPRQTPPYLMTTTTSPLSPANKPHHCSTQASCCARSLPRGCLLSL